MLQANLSIFAFLSTLVHLVICQSASTLDASICGKSSPLTTFSACNQLVSTLSFCDSDQVATGVPTVSCYCQQDVLNAIVKYVEPLHLLTPLPNTSQKISY